MPAAHAARRPRPIRKRRVRLYRAELAARSLLLEDAAVFGIRVTIEVDDEEVAGLGVVSEVHAACSPLRALQQVVGALVAALRWVGHLAAGLLVPVGAGAHAVGLMVVAPLAAPPLVVLDDVRLLLDEAEVLLARRRVP